MRGYNAIAGNVVPETVANVNLRGLGASRTLVLLNGRRQTYVPARLIGGRFVDVNAFPSIAIDRIEVLKEGASAIYGSDAVAGVANFVTRDEFAGFEVTGSYDHFAHAGDSNLGAIWGGGTRQCPRRRFSGADEPPGTQSRRARLDAASIYLGHCRRLVVLRQPGRVPHADLVGQRGQG